MNDTHDLLEAPRQRANRFALTHAMDAMRSLVMKRPSGQFYESVVVVWLTLSVASVVLAAANWATLLRQLNAANKAVAIRLEADSIFELMLQAESDQRGFVITGNPGFLNSLRTSATKLPDRFEHLAVLSRKDPTLLKRAMIFRDRVEAGLRHQQQVALAMQGKGLAAASAIAAGDEGQKWLAALRRDVAALGGAPSALVFDQGAGARAQLTRASLTSLVAGILGIGAGLFAFALSRLTVKHQERERELIQAKVQADRRSQEKTIFLANMSHEIRTPMNAILGFGELLGSNLQDEKQRDYLQSIRRSASSLLQLINDMLDMSKIEAGCLELHPEPIDLREFCQFIQTMFSEPASRKHLHLSLEMVKGLPNSLLLDRVRLRQILVNLVGNALKFTDHGRIELRIGREIQVPGKLLTLLIDVEDTGVGIPPDRLESIFNPFEQAGAHPEKDGQGTGLGLAIVKRLTEMMGGSVSVISRLGQGSVFQLRLPNVAISDAVPAADQLMGVAETNFDRLQPITVLGVDDNETNRQLLQAMLSDSHHRLLLASDGRQAIEMARQAKPDLILLDVRMPGMDGPKVLDALRDIADLKLTPIIAVTASSLIVEENAIKPRFNGCLQKPFTRQELFEEMARFLPGLRQAGRLAGQSMAPKQGRLPVALRSAPDGLESLVEENELMPGILTHDIKSSLAGVVMSADLLLEQPAGSNDEKTKRLVRDILRPGRRLLALVKEFSAQAAVHTSFFDDHSFSFEPTEKNKMPALLTDEFKAQFGRMQATAQKLHRLTTRRTETRFAQLAENIVRSCTELSSLVENLTPTGRENAISNQICLDFPKKSNRVTKRYRKHTQPVLLSVGLLTPNYSTHGLPGY
jgi:signal transduction histidine kinase